MLEVDHLDGFVYYHMTHIDNLRSILKSKALISKQILDTKQIKVRSIANQEVQNLRSRTYVWSIEEEQYRSLHSYVPFYFARQTPMLRNQYTRGVQSELIFFEVNRAYISLFTDGNASTQQLSKYSDEEVYIKPATVSNPSCLREYAPSRSLGRENNGCSNFYNDPIFLKNINWDVIYRRNHIDFEEYKRVVHAEALFTDSFPLDEMQSIIVGSQEMLNAVRAVFSDCGLTESSFDLPISYRPEFADSNRIDKNSKAY